MQLDCLGSLRSSLHLALRLRIASELGDAELARRFVDVLGAVVDDAAPRERAESALRDAEVAAYFATLFAFVDASLAASPKRRPQGVACVGLGLGRAHAYAAEREELP